MNDTITFSTKAIEQLRNLAEREPVARDALEILYSNPPPRGQYVIDPMPDILDCLEADLGDMLREYLTENPDHAETLADDWLNELDYDGRIHELVDGAVPVYDADQSAIMFFHGQDVTQAWENAGFGGEFTIPAGIYCLLMEHVAEFDAESVIDAWREAHEGESEED